MRGDVKNSIGSVKMLREWTMFNVINYSAGRELSTGGIIQRHFLYAGMHECVIRPRGRLTIAVAGARRGICSEHAANPDLRLLTLSKERDTAAA